MPEKTATSDSIYLALLDSVDAVIYVADMQTYELLFMNKMARETSGGSLGDTCWATLQSGQEGPCSFCTNNRLLDKDGNPNKPYIWEFQNTIDKEWYECRDQAVLWPDGRLVRMEIATNITVRKLAEQDLLEKNERLSFSLQGANSGIWDWNLKTNKVYFDENYFLIAGYQPDEFPCAFEEWEKRVHPEDISQTKAIIQSTLEQNKSQFTAEFRFHTKHETWMWILAQGKIVEWDDNGMPVRFIGLHTAINERKQAEMALRESEENLRTTLNSIGDAVMATDIHHTIVRMNPIAEQLTGWTAEEAIGQSLLQVFNIVNAKTGKTAENPVDKAIKTGKVVGLANHTILVARNGRQLQIADSAAPILNNRGETTGVVLVFRDVTEEYRMREELQKMQQLEKIGTLSGGLAHDFNNILSGIFGNISMAKNRTENNHPCMKYLDQAEISAERAKNLTGKLLTFAKGGAPIKDHIYLGELVKEVAEFDLSGSNVKLVFEQADNLWTAQVDKGQIQQVFSNLVINAFQAMPTGGHLYINLQNWEHTDDSSVPAIKPGKYIQATIRDEGEGIDEKDLTHIFDPYFSTKQTGQGLGLATVYSIVTKHDGHIQVESDVGHGTIFTLYLPAVDEEPTTESSMTHEEPLFGGQSLKVLCMDDEEIIRAITAEMLTRLGCSVESTAEGETAIKLYSQALQSGTPYDLVIMDLTIPGGMGGKDAIKGILNIDPHAKVIVSSGYANDPVMAHYTDYGFKGVATKPYTLDELRNVIEKTLKS